MKQKRAFTLIEIMIVIFLIGLIGSVIGYNMKGSLDEGRAFKTRQAKERLEDILELKLVEGFSMNQALETPEVCLEDAGIRKPDDLLNDGWGTRFKIEDRNGNIVVTSEKLKAWDAKKKKRKGTQKPE